MWIFASINRAMKMKRFYLFPALVFGLLISQYAMAQSEVKLTHDDKSALEGIIVEKYYVADSADFADTLGAALPKGSVTYRIYVDLKPNYSLQVVYGDEKHPLKIKTTTAFYNNVNCGALIGYNVSYLKVNEKAYALDSWITISSAASNYAGVLKSEDPDGSVLKRRSLNKSDGFMNGNLPMIKPFNLDVGFFNNDSNAVMLSSNNAAWAAFTGVLSGSKGPTASNKVLIAQLTTNGKLSFDLNIQVGTPSGGAVRFVCADAEGEEVKFDALRLSDNK